MLDQKRQIIFLFEGVEEINTDREEFQNSTKEEQDQEEEETLNQWEKIENQMKKRKKELNDFKQEVQKIITRSIANQLSMENKEDTESIEKINHCV